MNRHVERAALRGRSWLMSRRQPRRTLLCWAWSLVWWQRVVALVVIVPLAVLRWLAAQVVGFGLVLAGWSPPLTLAGLDELAPVEFGTVPAATTSTIGPTSVPVDDGFHTVSADVAARHALMDRVEAMQRQETAREQAWRQQVEASRPVRRPRRARSRRSFRSVVRVVLVLLAGWWLVLFVFGAVQSYRPLVNGPHGIHLPASVSASSQP